jgi:hypothetical protein
VIDRKSVGKMTETSGFKIPNVSVESVHRYNIKGEKQMTVPEVLQCADISYR